MKTVTIDYETYQEELSDASNAGFHEGISHVIHFLESGSNYNSITAKGTNEQWKRILKSLGRESEYTTR